MMSNEDLNIWPTPAPEAHFYPCLAEHIGAGDFFGWSRIRIHHKQGTVDAWIRAPLALRQDEAAHPADVGFLSAPRQTQSPHARPHLFQQPRWLAVCRIGACRRDISVGRLRDAPPQLRETQQD